MALLRIKAFLKPESSWLTCMSLYELLFFQKLTILSVSISFPSSAIITSFGILNCFDTASIIILSTSGEL